MSDDLVTWLREQIESCKAAAMATTPGPWTSWLEDRDHEGGDSFIATEGEDLYAYVKVGGTYNPKFGEDQDFIALNDPQHVRARCEAELAILAEHRILWRGGTDPANEEFSVISIGGADQDHGCMNCHYYGQGGVKGYGYCRTVRLLASGYRHRPGYREEWALPVAL
jgi:Family of unknown function (DUF6221)